MALNIAELIGGSIGDSVAKVVGAFKEDPTKKGEFQAAADANKAEFELTALKLGKQIELEVNAQAADLAKAQIVVNEADAKGNWFQAGWRPFVGWTCGSGLAYQLLLRPVINFGAQLFGSKATAEQLDMGTLLALLVPLLGLGAYRTVEKLQGKQ